MHLFDVHSNLMKFYHRKILRRSKINVTFNKML